MAPTTFAAEPGNWFLRGVQSALFYYISLTPCLQFQHKRKRRKEARAREAQAAAEIITTQPGIVRQPGAFQTNETWAEELMLGPGPPKGWKGDKLLAKMQKTLSDRNKERDDTARAPSESPEIPRAPAESALGPESSSRTSSSETRSTTSQTVPTPATRPPMERRLSNAMENIKDSLRTTLHPEKWNWKRYDREDEVLWGFSERMTRMWNRATAAAHLDHHDAGRETLGELAHGMDRRHRAATNESDRYDYHRVRMPEVNELHPPIVSQLPATRDDAAWMTLPPPSAAVMAGKKRPGDELEMRWPLAVIGRRPTRPEALSSLILTHSLQYAEASDDDLSVEGVEVQDYADRSDDTVVDRVESRRTKHLSDPIIKPPPIHPRTSVAGDALVPKRSDSWHFHYVFPPRPSVL